jgi:hypothetical protein
VYRFYDRAVALLKRPSTSDYQLIDIQPDEISLGSILHLFTVR